MRRFVPTRLKKPARPADFYITDRQILIADKSNRPFVGGGLLAELAVIAVQNATKTTLFNAPVQNISRIGYPIKDRYAISAGTYSPETYMLFCMMTGERFMLRFPSVRQARKAAEQLANAQFIIS